MLVSRRTTLFVGVLALSPAALGQGVSPSDSLGATGVTEKATGELARSGTDEPSRTGLSRQPTPIALHAAPIADLTAYPAFKSTKPLYGSVRLARERKIYFALDQSEPGTSNYDLLILDSDRDRDLSNDDVVQGANAFSESRGRSYTEFPPLEVSDLYYSGDVRESVAVLFYIWYSLDGVADRMFMSSASWREGTVNLKGTTATVCVFDEDNDALYDSGGEQWTLSIGDDQERWSTDRRKSVTVPQRVGGQPWKITSLSADGRLISLESETEHATVKAELGADPLLLEPPREKAEGPVLWVSDFDLALSAAKSEKKRVLLVFTTDWQRSSQRMEDRTWGDREVVETTGAFICVRRNGDLQGPLARRFGADVAPMSLVVDADGAVVDRRVGYLQPRSYAAWLRELRR